MEIQVLPRLSLGVRVTPAWEEAHITIRSPPVLSNGKVVWEAKEFELM
jgi:hypothetical protein